MRFACDQLPHLDAPQMAVESLAPPGLSRVGGYCLWTLACCKPGVGPGSVGEVCDEGRWRQVRECLDGRWLQAQTAQSVASICWVSGTGECESFQELANNQLPDEVLHGNRL